MAKKNCPAPTGDRRRGGVDAAVTGSASQIARKQNLVRAGRFLLQAYHVLADPVDRLKAITDPNTVILLGRISRGLHDCTLCRVPLDLDPKSDRSPGIVGYLHGDFPKEIGAIAVCACVRCVETLGNDGAALAPGKTFADELCGGGGTVQLVQGGVA
jgi:hypothetical protein